MNNEKRNVCRVCLYCDQGICTGIFDQINETFVYEKLNLIANINIKPKDGLPDKICSNCLVELENAIIFKQRCETSNAILISALNTNIGLPKQEHELPKVPIKEELNVYTEHNYLEEESVSLPELNHKPEEPDKQAQSIGSSKIYLEPPRRPSRAIDLKLECHDCGNLFTSKCKLKVHWFKQHLKTQLTCNICKNTFTSFKKLKDHKVNRTQRCATLGQVHIEGEGKKLVYHCKECVYSTNYVTTMTKHLKVHSGERSYACTLCPATYRYLNSFDAHMESKHGVFRKSMIVCNICGETMGSRTFYKHMRKHKASDSAKCNICDKVFKYKSYMKIHMERHAGVKKYACDKCGKSFTTENSLYKHIKSVHDHKQNIYNCNLCEFTINNRKKMNKHKLNHFKYDYGCTTCGKFFDNATQLSCHEERQHTNKNHPCQQCEKTFFTKKLLLSHIHKKHRIYSDKKQAR